MKIVTFLRSASMLLAFAAVIASRADGGAQHQAAQARPIQLGTSGGNIEDHSLIYCCSGTLGALVQDAAGRKFILSNNHVLARANQGQVGEVVNQPGMIDQGCAQAGSVATLAGFVEIQFGKGRNLPLNQVDAAIALVDEGAVRADGAILDIGTVSASTVGASVGQVVQKSGRTTGHTTGTVSATDVVVDVAYSSECGGAANQKARFVNQIRITPGSFSAGGDSGSAIFENGPTPRAVGLLFAGSSSSTIANPIDSVLSALNVTMVSGPPPPVAYGSIAGAVTDGNGDPISGATVSTDSGQSTTTAASGNFTIDNVPTGTRTLTVAAAGYASQSAPVDVTENQTANASFSLQPGPAGGGQAIVQCVTYSTQGGKNKDKDLLITITVVNDSGSPVAGAQVDISVTLDDAPLGSGTGATTDSSGQVSYGVRNAANGSYVTAVTTVAGAGLAFEGSTPDNSFAKSGEGFQAFCRDSSSGFVVSSSSQSPKRSLDLARAVKARHGDALMEIDEVVGHGLGRNNQGEPVIEVYVARENANARARIPASLENVPVRVVVTGPFLAF